MMRTAEDLLQELTALDESHRFDTLEIRAPLFTAIRRATNTVRDELIQSFSLPEGALTLEDQPTLPLRVIREANRTDTLNASSHLRRLRDLKLLEMKGSGSRTYYVPGPQFAARSDTDAAAEQVASPEKPAQNTHQSPSNTHQSQVDTHQLSDDAHQLLASLPERLRAKLPVAGTKPRKDVSRALIVELCAWRVLSAREIAVFLGGRDHKHLVREFLSPLVRDGLLAYTIPEMENHPDQRYTVPTNGTFNGGGTP